MFEIKTKSGARVVVKELPERRVLLGIFKANGEGISVAVPTWTADLISAALRGEDVDVVEFASTGAASMQVKPGERACSENAEIHFVPLDSECPHPSRRGVHEWYRGQTDGVLYCRACGAVGMEGRGNRIE